MAQEQPIRQKSTEIREEAEKLREANEKLAASFDAMAEAAAKFSSAIKQATDAPDAATSTKAKALALEEAKTHASNYAEYNKLLRTWFVAFGIGGIALFYTKQDLVSGMPRLVELTLLGALLLGSAAQVAIAFINKIMSWRIHEADYWIAINHDRIDTHYAEDDKKKEERRTKVIKRARRWRRISEWFWLDLWADCITIVCFWYSIVAILDQAALGGRLAKIVHLA